MDTESKRKKSRKDTRRLPGRFTLTRLITGAILLIVLLTLVLVVYIFIRLYRNSMEQIAVTSSEQAVVQVLNTVTSYTEEIRDLMEMVKQNVEADPEDRQNFFENLMKIRADVVAVTTYDGEGTLLNCWAGDQEVKAEPIQNLSYPEILTTDLLNISAPHVESLFYNSYPWVVTVSDEIRDRQGAQTRIAMDIRFSSIANYVDDVGIGQHGYCFIMDGDGNIVYHPQQELIYSGLKEERAEELKGWQDGTYAEASAIYTVRTLDTCRWRVVGVCYSDEMVDDRVRVMLRISLMILAMMMAAACVIGIVMSNLLSKPSRQLVEAMGEFEKNAENFQFSQVTGTYEINSLSDSFGHMVVRIQDLMEKVRREEITLRKTELNALQAQINPHFLYNTLSSIEWMCEEGRSGDAAEMVNALGRLFRISISKGHELITIEHEVQHAMSYLKIQNFRYKNQFSYTFDVEEDCLPCYCNKITLQPIIENAIYHGIDRMVEEGSIQIRIRRAGDQILMAVEDNGVGMSEEQCEEILHRERTDKSGIGIKNVNDRIQIYFGAEYGISITSEPDVGTCVEIRLPIVEDRSYGEKR